MKKRILLGCIIAVVVLLLMPSIPAGHLNSIQNRINQVNDVISEQPIFHIKGFPEIPERFPLLFLLISSIIICRLIRYYWLFEWSTEPGELPREYNIIHPLLYARSTILLLKTGLWITGWEGIANYFGWDWKFILPLDQGTDFISILIYP